jgi:hypothetical protein
MNPTEVVRAVVAAAPDALYVASLGTPTSALRAASDDGPHLYLGGSMDPPAVRLRFERAAG